MCDDVNSSNYIFDKDQLANSLTGQKTVRPPLCHQHLHRGLLQNFGRGRMVKIVVYLVHTIVVLLRRLFQGDFPGCLQRTVYNLGIP